MWLLDLSLREDIMIQKPYLENILGDNQAGENPHVN